MDKNYIYLKDKKYEKIEHEDGRATLIHVDEKGFKTTLNFTNDINKHNEAMKALWEFFVKPGL